MGAGLWRIPVAGGTPERLTVGAYDASDPTISRKGYRLAYTQRSGGDTNIYRIEIPTATARANSPVRFISSTRNESQSQFSPDSHRIVFSSDRSGSDEIWTCNSDGSNPVQLTFLGGAGTPRWSPDGRQIAFDSNARGNFDIYVIDAAGGLPRLLTTETADDNLLSWSKDGRWIYFASKRSGDYQEWKVPAEGGEAVQITKQGGYVAFESPDGKFVYYTKKDTPGIWRAPVEGGKEIPVIDSFNLSDNVNWALVTDGIYFIDSGAKEGAAIEFFSLITRRITKVAELGKVYIFPNGFAVSPDRRSFLYTQADTLGSSDIMLVENFR